MKWNITARKAAEAFVVTLAATISASPIPVDPELDQFTTKVWVSLAVAAVRAILNALKHIDD